MTALVSIEWTHPSGRVREELCRRHEAAVLKALRTLGIGCTGEAYSGPRGCGRCAAEEDGVEARFYLGLTGH